MKSIVLSGGGSLGCFEAGFLYQTFDEIKYENLCGTSAGSLNCLLLAQAYLKNDKEIIKQAYYEKITGNSKIYSKNYLRTVFGWGKPPYGYKPLRKLLSEIIDFKSLLTIGQTLKLTSVDLITGDLVTFSNKDKDMTADKLLNAAVASASIPPAFDPVIIDGYKLVDGGIRANIPVCNIVADDEVNHAIVLLCFPPNLDKLNDDYSGIIGIASRTLDIILNQVSISSLKSTIQTNKLIDLFLNNGGNIYNSELNNFLFNKKIVDLDIIAPDKELPGSTLDFNPKLMKKGFEIGQLKGIEYLNNMSDIKYHNI